MPLTEWLTPKGNVARLQCRDGTNDAMVAENVITQDAYRVAGLDLSGTALDVGAHIGALTVVLGLDNPELNIIAVEPVPDNVALLGENVVLNGLNDRVTIVEGTAGRKRSIRYNWRGSEAADMHRFIADQNLPDDTEYDEITPPAFSLAKLVKMAGGKISFGRIDDTDLLDKPAAKHIAIVRSR